MPTDDASIDMTLRDGVGAENATGTTVPANVRIGGEPVSPDGDFEVYPLYFAVHMVEALSDLEKGDRAIVEILASKAVLTFTPKDDLVYVVGQDVAGDDDYWNVDDDADDDSPAGYAVTLDVFASAVEEFLNEMAKEIEKTPEEERCSEANGLLLMH